VKLHKFSKYKLQDRDERSSTEIEMVDDNAKQESIDLINVSSLALSNKKM